MSYLGSSLDFSRTSVDPTIVLHARPVCLFHCIYQPSVIYMEVAIKHHECMGANIPVIVEHMKRKIYMYNKSRTPLHQLFVRTGATGTFPWTIQLIPQLVCNLQTKQGVCIGPRWLPSTA